MQKYEKLLEELGILSGAGSYEIGRQLKEKKNELKLSMTSRQSEEENKRIEQEIHAIQEAEAYFKKLSEEEKKEDRLDDFDYSSFQNMSGRKQRAKYVVPVEVDDTQDEENELLFEERYDNIIGYMGTPDGFTDGLKQLEQLAEDGYVVAQYRLGNSYYYGEKQIAEDWNKALYWYEKAANQGDAYSQNMMGVIYTNENDYVEQDIQKAIYWFEKAAEQNYPIACWNLAFQYDHIMENINHKDNAKAFYWFKKAAELGCTDAYNRLGLYYHNGCYTDKNVTEAIKWYEKAAANGEAAACWNLGLVYDNEEEVKDSNKAFYWYKRAAEAGYQDAFNVVGNFYCKGLETEKNITEAIEWYEKAAANGEAAACWNLGLVYDNEEEVKDSNKAFYWYKRAAEKGFSKACNMIGVWYQNGIKIRKNIPEAIKWYEKAAEQGNINSYYNLGLIYSQEEVKDEMKAFYWFKKSAETGNPKACNSVGRSYYIGLGTCSNLTEAVRWFEKGAELGNVVAARNLGFVYNNEKVLKDNNKAFYWYTKAAEAEDSEAMYELGKMYETIKRDDYKASQWYLKAIQCGNHKAQIAFDKLSKRSGH